MANIKRVKAVENTMAWAIEYDDEGGLGIVSKLMPLREIEPDEVLIEVHFASINYRDMLASQGNLGVARRFPYIPGVDASGIVIKSTNEAFVPGDSVFLAAIPFGAVLPGCWSTLLVAKAGIVRRLPAKWSLSDAVVCGTAGQSASLSVAAIERYIGGILPGQRFLVTGATGGVGSLSVSLLASMGCEVVAASRKRECREFLTELGAAEVVHPDKLVAGNASNLLKAEYSGVIDTVGGDILEACLKRLKIGGALGSVGLVKSQSFTMTVLPFLMRGIGLLGAGTEVASPGARNDAWERLENGLTRKQLDLISSFIEANEISSAMRRIEDGSSVGRTVIKVQVGHSNGCLLT